MIYLDYAAGTPVDPRVLSRFIETETRFQGNPNSLHLSGGAARGELERVTKSIAQMLSADENEIIYTSGASEANNAAIKGIASSSANAGRHIISTALEHASVGASLTALQERGYEIDLVRIGGDGKIDLGEFRSLLRRDTVLAVVSAVDSELGTIQPIPEIREILSDYPNCRLHVDATQAIGKIPFSFQDADTVSFSPHKFYGIVGCGILYKNKNVAIEPLIHGGSGISLYRGGTPALALDASAEEALRLAIGSLSERAAVVRERNLRLRAGLSTYAKVRFNSPGDAVPYILNLSVDGVSGNDFQRALSLRDVCVSVKSACSSDAMPSRAVMAVSRNRRNALSSWRISLSHLTRADEIDRFFEIFDHCYRELTQ